MFVFPVRVHAHSCCLVACLAWLFSAATAAWLLSAATAADSTLKAHLVITDAYDEEGQLLLWLAASPYWLGWGRRCITLIWLGWLCRRLSSPTWLLSGVKSQKACLTRLNILLERARPVRFSETLGRRLNLCSMPAQLKCRDLGGPPTGVQPYPCTVITDQDEIPKRQFHFWVAANEAGCLFHRIVALMVIRVGAPPEAAFRDAATAAFHPTTHQGDVLIL